MPAEPRAGLRLAAGLVAVVLVTAGCGSSSNRPAPSSTTSTSSPTSTAAVPPGTSRSAMAFYYLWWDTAHWHARLGPHYPYTADPLPLPATLGGAGCQVTNDYVGNQLTDVPPALWTQDDPAQIHDDVVRAAGAGLAGFAVGWAGTGQPGQTASSSAFDRRLSSLVDAVHQVNRAGTPFTLWIAYMSSAAIRTRAAMDNDLAYLQAAYGSDPAFTHANGGRMTLVMMGSRKYPQTFLDATSARWRSTYYLVGDENWRTWDKAKAADFDADQYYWSSQDPYRNPASFARVAELARQVRSTTNPDGSAKQFFSPLAPGYDKVLGGGHSCVPRLDGRTMRALFAGNAAASPDGWMVISWNEIDEGTYLVPMTRYGTQGLETLRALLVPPTGRG